MLIGYICYNQSKYKAVREYILITFIINPTSGGGRYLKVWKRLETYLKQYNLKYNSFITKYKGEAREITARICAENCKDEENIVVAVGGDGTVNDMIEGICTNKKLIFGHIPAGTGNDLARGLGLPKNPYLCLKRILDRKHIKALDYGILSFGSEGHKRFLVSSGIGFDAGIVEKYAEIKGKSRYRGGILKKFTYIKLGIKHLFEAKTNKGFILIDGVKKLEFNNIYFISTHIHPYEGGGFKFAPKAKNNDGELSICLIHQKSRYKFIKILLASLLGGHLNYSGVKHYDCKEICIHFDAPCFVHADGELCGEYSDITLSCIPEKLKFIC